MRWPTLVRQLASVARKSAPLGRFSALKVGALLVSLLCVLGWTGTGHYAPWVSWHAEAHFFLATWLAGFLVLWGVHKGDLPASVLQPVGPEWLLLALMGLVLIQGVAGMVLLGDAVIVGLYLSLMVIAVQAGRTLAWRSASQRASSGFLSPAQWLSVTLVVVAVLSTTVGFAQVLGLWETSTWVLRMSSDRRAGGNLGQPNHLATLIVMGIASVGFLHATQRLKTASTGLLLLTLCTGLALTQSRTGALSLLALAVWWFLKAPGPNRRPSRGLATVLTVMGIALFLLWPRLQSWLFMGSAIVGSDRVAKAAVDSRLTIWPQLVEAIMQCPWLGWGVLQTPAAHAAVISQKTNSLPLTYSHNLVLDLGIWFGIPIALFLVAVLGLWLVRRLVATLPVEAWFGAGLVVPMAVHSMLEFPFAYAYLLVPAMMGIGLLSHQDADRRTLLRRTPAVATTLVAVSAVVGTVTALDYLRAEEEFRAARFEMLRIGPQADGSEKPDMLLLSQLQLLLDAAWIQMAPEMSEDDMEVLRRAANRYPWSGPQFRYAMALGFVQRWSEFGQQLNLLKVRHGDRVYLPLRDEAVRQLRAGGIEPPTAFP